MERVRIVDKYTIVPQMRHGHYGFIEALALERSNIAVCSQRS